MYKKILALMALSALVIVAGGCDKNDGEQNRSVVSVASLNSNSSMVSDVLEQGENVLNEDGTDYDYTDDYIAADVIPVLFHNRPYSTGLTITDPSEPYGDFLITRYEVEWQSVAGGPTLPDYTAGISIQIPTGEFVEGFITLVTFNNKIEPFIVALQYAPAEVQMLADITFYGHEIGTDRETAVKAQLGVLFVDLVTESRQ